MNESHCNSVIMTVKVVLTNTTQSESSFQLYGVWQTLNIKPDHFLIINYMSNPVNMIISVDNSEFSITITNYNTTPLCMIAITVCNTEREAVCIHIASSNPYQTKTMHNRITY